MHSGTAAAKSLEALRHFVVKAHRAPIAHPVFSPEWRAALELKEWQAKQMNAHHIATLLKAGKNGS